MRRGKWVPLSPAIAPSQARPELAHFRVATARERLHGEETR
jgi:hypothetical protein